MRRLSLKVLVYVIIGGLGFGFVMSKAGIESGL
jgi:hypothetical protein